MYNDIEWIGDVHLGKPFKTGVPLHRQGDREVMVADDLSYLLLNPKKKISVQVGDIFDGFKVPMKYVLLAAELYSAAAFKNRDVQYFVLRGNHDASRDADEKSAFDVFARLMAMIPNVTVVEEPMVHNGMALIPWDPFRSPEEQVAKLDGENYILAVGHWDTGGYGRTDNLIPYDAFCLSCDTVVTGHVHTPEVFIRGKRKVHVVGSLQPYTHAEDPHAEWYLTMTSDQLELKEPEEIVNMNIRLLLKEGEGLPENLNCLSLVGKRMPAPEEEEQEEVTVADFDFKKVFHECMTEEGVGSELSEILWDLQVREDNV